MANTFTYKNEEFHTGDTVKLHVNVTEGDKTRTQVFEGIIISIQNAGTGKSFVVRKIAANGIGVERIMPLNSPSIEKIEKKSLGNVRRAKLYYLRDRVGKQATKVRTRIMQKVAAAPAAK